MTFIILKTLHLIGLMMGGGAGFGAMIVGGALRRADDGGKAALAPLMPKLANIGLVGVVLMWITGVAMSVNAGGMGEAGLWFWLKLLAAAGVLALAVFGFIMRRRMAKGQAVPPYATRLPMLASPLSLLAVILAVMAFN